MVAMTSERYWLAEYQPPSLVALCDRLAEALGVSRNAVGSKGDVNHLYGYHRSAAWVRHSAFSIDRSYSVTETAGNRNPGDENWLCAIDVTLPLEQLLQVCQRLDAAVRSGRLEKVVEWYGNLNGDQRVDGYDNIRNLVASSDSSHLWHLHMSFDRGRAGEDHSDLFQILIEGDDDMATNPQQGDIDGWRLDALINGYETVVGGPYAGEQVWIVKAIKELATRFPANPVQLEVDAWRGDALAVGAAEVRGGPLAGERMWLVEAINALAEHGGGPAGATAAEIAAKLVGDDEFTTKLARRLLAGLHLVQAPNAGA